MMALLKAGDEILVVDNVYKPVRRFCDNVLKRFGVEVTYFDPAHAAGGPWSATASDAVRMILMESPGSLSFEMQDTPRSPSWPASAASSPPSTTPGARACLFKPLAHGIDLSIQALTKYVGGHSDVFMGSAAARDPALVRKLADGVNHMGWAVSGEDAYAMLRGLRTLPRADGAAGRQRPGHRCWLRDQPEVAQVLHPALPGAPGHELWARDFRGACGLFGFVLKPGARGRP